MWDSERIAAAAKVVSELYLQAPSQQLRTALADPEMLAQWPLNDPASVRGISILQEAINGGAGAAGAGGGAGGGAGTAEDEAHDHLYLYVGIGRPLAQPCESPYFSDDGLVFDEDTFAVRRWYQKYGMAAANHRLPDDHIGVEFAFIGELATRGELVAAQDFVTAHLGRFAPQVFAATSANAISPTYKALPELSQGILDSLATATGFQNP
ncbi:TorD/DmsD family molecular chaperone [Corynebacterium caspium]|uniref:TorD/DmsD family molecular chaperone n=1 Tax=Corynebacterium caspium TaxID=234828 RepID=UPI000374395F|nr:molecular chaperone TorD family protein [Corynebacterium caspium]WKD58811.1 twin-argninine leader-binding protein DmsD [Corynebacterium caspium DSM 44850]